MDIYIVIDDIDGYIEGVYDIEGIKKLYPSIITKSCGCTYWAYCYVKKYTINSDDGVDVKPQDIENLINNS